MGAGSALVLMGAALWPFGGGAGTAEPTIGSLKESPVIERHSEVVDGDRLAREHYERFLELEDAPAVMRAEALQRLAGLYLARAEEANAAAELPAADAAFARSIGLFQRYLDEFPERGDADQALYSLARAREGVGDIDDAMQTLDQLVLEHPASPFFAEAQFRRAERLFLLKGYEAAEAAYAAVLATSDNDAFHEQALYKQGWTRLKLGEPERSLDPFLGVLQRRLAHADEHSDLQPLAGLGRTEQELIEDTLRAMALSIAQLGGMDDIDALIDRHPQIRFADVIYGGLGDLYLEQERWSDAAGAYSHFVRRSPAHPRAPLLQARVIKAWTAAELPGRTLEARAEYVGLYGLDSAYWHGIEPASRPDVLDELKASLGELASHDHQRAQQDGAAEAYQQAAGWYRRYLAYFPDDPESAGRNFLLAELLFEAGEFGEATLEYQRSAYHYGQHEQAAEAGYAGLLAAREHEKSLTGSEFDSWYEALIDEDLRFAAAFPDHPQAAAVETAAAEDLFQRGELLRALEVADRIVTRMPPAEVALERVAWTVLAHSEFELGHHARAEQAYVRLRNLGSDDVETLAQIEERIAASVYRQAEAAREAGDHDTAVATFLRVAEAAPDALILPDAVYDAAMLLVSDQQWEEAISVLQRYRETFPEHRFQTEAAQQLALALEAAGHEVEAADAFAGLAVMAGLDDAVQGEALWRAAALYRSAAEAAAEAEVLEEAVARFAEPLRDAQEGRQRLAELALDAGDEQARRHWLEAIVQADAGAGGRADERSRWLAAHASFELARPLHDAFLAMRITVPLAPSLKRKTDALEETVAAYGKAAGYAVSDVTTAATFETAELYRAFGQALLESERPADLGADEQEEYGLLLEEQAFPFEEKAIGLHVLNAERAADGVYDEWVRRSFVELAQLSPARFAREERSEPYVLAMD